MQIHTCHRGLEWLKFRFTGRTVHGGAQREGINAIAKAVSFINAMEEKLIPEVFSRTHPLMKEATVNYAVIHGGTQLSTVAGECELSLDRRFLPYEKYDDVIGEFQSLLDELSEKDPNFHCEMSVCEESFMKNGYIHLPMETPPDDPLVAVMRDAVRTVTGKEAVTGAFPAWTDAGLLNGYAHIPAVIFAPGKVEYCHSKEEHIPVDQLPEAALIYALAAVEFCGAE